MKEFFYIITIMLLLFWACKTSESKLNGQVVEGAPQAMVVK